MRNFVSFRNIKKSYDGDKLVVRNLNLDVAEGEFLTLLGPSGSGKTTSLMMLAGFETPTDGEILLRDKPLHTLPPHQRDIGMVFQNYALFPHMTVAENLAFPLSIRRLSKADIKVRVKRVLDMIKLTSLADRYPAQMSGGQQQRVALARALVFEPRLILMDEPLGALDKQLREHMQMEIKQLHNLLGLTIVYVTHDQSEAMTMSDRVAVFNDGMIQQMDSPSKLYEQPDNAFVAQFIGENNCLLATQSGQKGEYYQVALDNGVHLDALKVRPSSPGKRIQLSIRPERINVNAPKPGDQSVQATIQQFIYLGDHVRMLTDVAGQGNFMVKLASSDVAPEWKPGSEVMLSWQPQHLRALDVTLQ
ncbi:ABC transporter ATP-binding protein [Pantoea sp. BS_4]|uniref:Spermidine/putrescine import ATP-binding protein PotA n=1 Tax=Pantoea stewartii TaxID=66269 RepID=A0AB34VIQ4_9GAMM|nr:MULTISPECIES: ABC transporter ATP-binding protein [Pantoea]KHE00062.1 spermidine/putrescine ABC transporter ATP-binding protein [Pantoea stewartii]KHN62724.1 spermidine/putrescine ABC transporter ATP-binding protein [Pantoea stewartii]KTS73916.1 spermidine/putrescine ABC transporter ATP-binding protein [Pantoea stewartii]KTS98443.1 spermidine/putrescine ABC transporter ATP-binding protein [Pantoea stewartii]KTT09622.1 spermidine/putrescine ABC transporter ATP-binding protein [Pantoea stewar